MSEIQRRLVLSVREDLELRMISAEDAPAAFEMINHNREHLRPWLHWVDATVSMEDMQEVIAHWEARNDSGTALELGIFYLGRYIGKISLFDISQSVKKAEIGYWLAADQQGKGIMTDCVTALVDYAFETLELNRVCIYCAVENEKSRAVPVRLGFTQEGILREEQCLYGVYHDLAVYGMLRREWAQKHHRLV
jgi:ribosomal-protein-serine acetyltransferase